MIKTIVISCAGLGSRLGMNIPKCLIKVEGKTLLEYQLRLFKNVPDVRIVVGYKKEMVIEEAKRLRQDVTIIENDNYATTSNSDSLYLGINNSKDPILSVDGDMLISVDSFNRLNQKCFNDDIIGITKAKTDDAVFAIVKNNKIQYFSRTEKSEFEWCGIAYINNRVKIKNNRRYVYEQFIYNLPLDYFEIDCYEIDTQDDYKRLIKNFERDKFYE